MKVDWSSEYGANVLANKLKRHWLKRGVQIKTWIEALHEHGEHPIYCVRSDILTAVRRKMQ